MAEVVNSPVYMVTHSLLSSWLYAMRDNPFEDATTERDAFAEFMQVLRREPTEPTDAMLDGIEFEDLVTDIIRGGGDTEHRWFPAAERVAKKLGHSVLQYKAKKVVDIDGIKVLLYGRLDALGAGAISDIKFSSKYERGKYIDSTQHPMYMEIVPEAEVFRYIISSGTDVWTEEYRREETPDIIPIVRDFFSWLHATSRWGVFTEHWVAL